MVLAEVEDAVVEARQRTVHPRAALLMLEESAARIRWAKVGIEEILEDADEAEM